MLYSIADRLLFAGDDEAGEPEQGAFEIVVGEAVELGDGVGGELGRFLVGGGNGLVAGEDGEDVRVGDAVEGALLKDGLDAGALLRGAVLKGVDDGESGFAFAQVAGDRLAEDHFRGGKVQNIIGDLEGHADGAAVFAKLELLLLAGSGKNSAELHADGEEASGFAIDEIEVAVAGDERAELFHLEEFALDHLLGELGEQIEDVKVTLLKRDLKGLHVEPVAGEDALGISPDGVGRRTATADIGGVDDVIVHESCGVDDLDDGSEAHGSATLVVEQLGGEQKQSGAESLAATLTQVIANLGDGLNVGNTIAAELAFDGLQVLTEKVEDFFAGP